MFKIGDKVRVFRDRTIDNVIGNTIGVIQEFIDEEECFVVFNMGYYKDYFNIKVNNMKLVENEL